MSDLWEYRGKLPAGIPSPKSKKARIRKKWFRRALAEAHYGEAIRLLRSSLSTSYSQQGINGWRDL